ncbi:MAG: diguanylate cyclase [Bradyrhizobium sp.]|jgi:diguanylate cyclase (GGDEF)-like protein/PAS domain S-box-containing protein|uniref:sensor domain-containing diguanylate cyclase n=1 Tax=Bradyrhizobium sp. TaxID=376 RepID=UPI00120E8537|nr:diguanylate cyclase [Bradyrhizobium sp.]THD51303.1 MAG: diguanylate cyclase [Bradyrhizobium sp.]
MARAKKSEVAHAYAVRLMQHLVVPTFVIDAKRRVVIWNRACERVTGVAASEVLGTSRHWRAFYAKRRYCLADLVALGRPDKLSELYPEQHTVPDGNSFGFSAENWCVMPKLGDRLYLALDAGPIHDEDGNLIAVVETLRDMTDQKRAEMALKALAVKDGLTGLANRRCFDLALEMEWSRAQRTKKPLALLFADVDHFKLFNDQHGHQRGDECLREVAAVIGESASRPIDLAARYGGEEFAIILPETDREGACKVADRLRQAVMDLRITHDAAGAGPWVTLSVGVVAHVPGSDVGPDWFLGQADQALYAAKRLGRNRVITADAMLAAFADPERRDRDPPDLAHAARR